jgi:hypothetical protein
MKTEFISETIVMKSLARRERRRLTIVSESPKTYIDFYGNEAISSSTIFTVKIKYNKYKRVKKKRK